MAVAEAIDPVGLVRQYVKRDANGERLQSNPWFQDATTWPDEPAYDSFSVIRSYTVVPPATIAGSPAKITVRYDRIGWAIPEVGQLRFIAQWLPQVVVFVVVRTDEGWRIESPQIAQRVLAEVAAATGFFTAEDAARMRALAAEAPPDFSGV